MMDWKTVLFAAPHTDDAELGCGGTMARLLEQGSRVHVAVFSSAAQSLPPGAPETLLREECQAATARLGVPADNLTIFDYPVRHFPAHRQEILEDLVALRARIRPEAVFAPASGDLHQDHQVVHAECLRAFKDYNLFGYELPWNQISFSAQAFVDIQERHLVRKIKALGAYASQRQLNRVYFSEDFQRSLARVRGTQNKTSLAEAFEVLRLKL